METSQPLLLGRNHELAQLQAAIASRRSLLLHGPAGVGKTALLRAVIAGVPGTLYCDPSDNFSSVLRQIAVLLVRYGDPVALKKLGAGGARTGEYSVVSLKGIVARSLAQASYSIALDHIGFASQAFVSSLKHVITPSATPLIVTARSTHMEDAGFLRKLFPFKSDRFELRGFDPQTARSFAARAIREAHLDAGNLREFEQRLLQASSGNPGAILRMVEMARQPKYRSAESVLFAPLYIDFKLYGQGDRA